MTGLYIIVAALYSSLIVGLVEGHDDSYRCSSLIILLTSVSSFFVPSQKPITDFLVLSNDVLALVRSTDNAVELCRIGTASAAPLQTVCLLEHPPLLPHVRLVTATPKTEINTSAIATHQQSCPPP